MVEKKTYNVRIYWCKLCGHMFHSIKVGLKTCNKVRGDVVCGGELKVIDTYKSPRQPRVSPPPGGRWQVKGGLYEKKQLG